MTKQELGEELYSRKNGVLKGIDSSLTGELETGKNLLAIKKGRLYRAESPHMPSFGYWVEGEMGISRSVANRKIDVYLKWGELLAKSDFTSISYEKLVLLSKVVTDKTSEDEKRDLLHMAQDQTLTGLRNNIRERQNKVATDVCSHKEENQELWNKCKTCGKFWR